MTGAKKTISVIAHELLRKGFISITVSINFKKLPHKITVVAVFINSPKNKSAPRLLCNHFRSDGSSQSFEHL